MFNVAAQIQLNCNPGKKKKHLDKNYNMPLKINISFSPQKCKDKKLNIISKIDMSQFPVMF